MASVQVSSCRLFTYQGWFFSDYCELIISFFLFKLILFSTLNGCYGIPWVHYKGRQGDFYILVSFILLLIIKMYFKTFYLSIKRNYAYVRSWIYLGPVFGTFGILLGNRKISLPLSHANSLMHGCVVLQLLCKLHSQP